MLLFLTNAAHTDLALNPNYQIFALKQVILLKWRIYFNQKIALRMNAIIYSENKKTTI